MHMHVIEILFCFEFESSLNVPILMLQSVMSTAATQLSFVISIKFLIETYN